MHAPGVGTRQTLMTHRNANKDGRNTVLYAERSAVPRQLSAQIYGAALHANYPVSRRSAIQDGPSVKAFKLFQTVCRAGRATNSARAGGGGADRGWG